MIWSYSIFLSAKKIKKLKMLLVDWEMYIIYNKVILFLLKGQKSNEFWFFKIYLKIPCFEMVFTNQIYLYFMNVIIYFSNGVIYFWISNKWDYINKHIFTFFLIFAIMASSCQFEIHYISCNLCHIFFVLKYENNRV